jgi:hypothetical protein
MPAGHTRAPTVSGSKGGAHDNESWPRRPGPPRMRPVARNLSSASEASALKQLLVRCRSRYRIVASALDDEAGSAHATGSIDANGRVSARRSTPVSAPDRQPIVDRSTPERRSACGPRPGAGLPAFAIGLLEHAVETSSERHPLPAPCRQDALAELGQPVASSAAMPHDLDQAVLREPVQLVVNGA